MAIEITCIHGVSDMLEPKVVECVYEGKCPGQKPKEGGDSFYCVYILHGKGGKIPIEFRREKTKENLLKSTNRT